jgi:competence protein ComEC
MPLYALAILFGTLVAFYGNQPQDSFWSAYLPLLLLLFRFCPPYRFVCLLAVGLLWGNVALHGQLAQRLVDGFDNRGALLVGTIADLPRVDSDRVSLQLDELNIDAYPAAMPRRISLNWYQSKQLPMAGERWQFLVRLRQPRGQLNPAGFDYEAWQFVQGIDARGYVLDSKLNRRLAPASPLSISGLRQRLAANIERDCQGCRHSGLIKALAVGFRGDIDPSSRQLLQSTGTAHLLAISGLHIAMVAYLLFGAGRYIWRFLVYRTGINRREMASLCALGGAIAYAAMAGFSLPTLRALIMLAVVLIGQQLHNSINLLQSISLALVVVLIFDPLAVGSASFWLSFGALMTIAYVQFRLPRRMNGWRQLLILQFYFTLLFAPLGVFIFGQINISALPANLVAIPLLSLLILPLVLTACLLSTVWSEGASLAFNLADRLLGYLFDYFDILLAAGLRSRIVDDYPALLLLLALCAILLLLLPRLRGLSVVALAITVVVLCWQPARLKPGEFELLVLDVGMGSSVLLRTSHHSLVYDFGPGRNDRFNAARRALLPVMQRLGIDEADLLIASHVDQDHSGGLHSFIGSYRPTQLLSGTPRELHARFALQHRVRSCHDYPDWRWDGISFSFLDATDDSVKQTTNDRSCILLVNGHHRVLLPGDIEALQEGRLVESFGAELRADVLLAPHHGSGTSSSQPFIDSVRPSEVVFTVSRKNRWDFPDETVISRYRAIDARLHRSDQDGAIRFYSKAGALRVTSLRRPPQRSWRRW